MIIDQKKSTYGVKNHIVNLWTQTISHIAQPRYSTNFFDVKKTKRVPFTPARILELQSHLLETLQSLLILTQKPVLKELSIPPKKEQLPAPEIPFHFSKLLTRDAWGFGMFWQHIQCVCQTPQNLYQELALRRSKIGETQAQFSSTLSPIPGLTELLALGNLTLNPIGVSGSYILYDTLQNARFIIKPFDEDAGAMNNPKGFASPFLESPLTEGISLYRSCLREVAAFQAAECLRIRSIVPPTQLALIKNHHFFDLSEQVSPRELQTYFEQVGYHVNKEKLCSIQEFVLESKSLFEALQEFQTNALLDEEIEALFDQKDFEEANLLLWVTGDADGHANNFLVFPKHTDEIGNQILGLKKIDNSLAFPELNTRPNNFLSHLPNAKYPLSPSTREKILQIDQKSLSDILARQGLQNSLKAMQQRIKTLQLIVRKNPSWSIQTIQNQLFKNV